MRRRSRLSAIRPLLSRGQTILAVTLILLVVALAGVVVLAYININTAASFQSAYVLTNLANVQRGVIELHVETNRLLRDRSPDFAPLRTLRDNLQRQIELARIESSGVPRISSGLYNLEMLLDHFDYEINRLAANPTEIQFRTASDQLDNVLGLLDSQMETLYTQKEMEFYAGIDQALELQRTSQTLTVGIGALLLVFGVFLVVSIRRSVSGEFERAYHLLMAEVTERRRAEEELRQHNEYLAALHETSLALMNRLDTADLLETVVIRAAQMLGTEHGYVYLVNPARNMMERKVGVGFYAQSIGFTLERGQGLAGHVWETGGPLLVNDYGAWANRVSIPGVQDRLIQAVMGVPLTSGGQIVGVIGLAYTGESGRNFGDREVRLLDGFARLASIALDNARLFSEAAQRTMQVEALYHADQELYLHLDMDGVLTTLVNVAVETLKADKSMLLVWNEAHTHLHPGASRGFRPDTLERLTFAPGQGLVGQVATERRPVTIQDTTADRRVDWQITYPEGIRSFIHVPIVLDDEVFGVFNVSYGEPFAFGDEDVRLILALAQRAAAAIQNARLYAQAQQAATLEERQRLARELHDAVTQTLFSASIIADVLPQLWKVNPQEANHRVDELRDLTRGALAEMRTLLLELRPKALLDTPIGELLQQLGEAIVGRARVPVTVAAQSGDKLPVNVKVAFYRIAQEALNNIAKHAGATQVNVTLRYDGETARLCICDDGVGFLVDQLLPDNLGLRIMHERSAAVGATLDIASAPGEGTTVTAVWRSQAQQAPMPGDHAMPAGQLIAR